MNRYLINLWALANCAGNPMQSIIVERGQCVEPAFGLSFRANGSHITLANNCSESFFVNTIDCPVSSGCCYVPYGLSVNISMTGMDTSKNETRAERPPNGNQNQNSGFESPLPQPAPGRRFICNEV